jgi:PAS domain S-box-containing protein
MRPEPRDRLLWYVAPALFAVISLAAFGASAFVSATRWVDHTLEVQKSLDEWMIAVVALEANADGYLISGHASFLETYSAAVARERAKAAQVRSLVADNSTQTRNADTADRDAVVALDLLQQMVALVRAGAADRARPLAVESMERADHFREDVQVMREEEDLLLQERRSNAALRTSLALTVALILVIACVGLMALAWRLQKRVAKEVQKRLNALADVAQALASTRTQSEVAEAIVEHGTRIVGADICTLHMLVDDETSLALIGERGVAPEVADRIRRIAETTGGPDAFKALRSGTALWAESEADYAALFPALARMEARGPRAKAFWSIPLVGEGHPVGLLAMGFYAPRNFSREDRAFVDAFAKQCAQALLRAARLEREDAARRWLTTTLRSIGDAVIATDDEGRITFMNHVAADLTGWTENDAQGRPIDEVFSIFSDVPGEGMEGPVRRVLREGTSVRLVNHVFLHTRQDEKIPIDDSAAPIRDENGKLLGAVLVFRDVRQERARQARSEFLAQAGEALVSSLDYRATLANVARLAVPDLADWCAVDILEPGDQAAQQVAVAHVDPAKMDFARQLGERYPPDPNALTGAPHVIRTGKSELYTKIPAELLEAGARDAEHLRIIRALRLESAMVVALHGRDRPLGAMTFVYADSGRHYTESDLEQHHLSWGSKRVFWSRLSRGGQTEPLRKVVQTPSEGLASGCQTKRRRDDRPNRASERIFRGADDDRHEDRGARGGGAVRRLRWTAVPG